MLQENTRVRFIPDERRDDSSLHPIPAHTGTVVYRTTDGFYRMSWDDPNPLKEYFNLERVFTEERLEKLETIQFATVVYPVTLSNVEVPAGSSEDERREIIYKLAETFFPSGLDRPVLHDCSDEDLID